MLGQAQLSRSLFPVGGLPKAETRRLAEAFGLPVAGKPDSQELCFAPSGDAGGFVRSTAPALVRSGGEVVGPDGTVLGEHDGTFAFTIGQRRGLGVAIGEPAYVLDVDATANRVVVGPQVLLARRGLVADRASWVAGEPPTDGPFEAQVRIRYQGEDCAGRSSSPSPVASAWSSVNPSAPSRRDRARWSTGATRCSAAAASSSRYAEAIPEERTT